MAGQRNQKTYNSQGLVNEEDSRNSSQARMRSLPDSNCSLSLNSSIENSIPQIFLVISNGLHPGIATELVQTNIESLKQLSQYMASIFTYGVRTKQVDIAVIMVKQFRKHKHYAMALVYSLNMVTQARIDVLTLSSFMTTVYKKLDRTGCLTPLLVDTLVSWVSSHTMNKMKEVCEARAAMQMIQQAGSAICNSSVLGYMLVFAQVRAGLVGGGMGAETREVLLDIIVIMGRHVMPGEDKFVVKIKEEEVISLKKKINAAVVHQKQFMEESMVSVREEFVNDESVVSFKGEEECFGNVDKDDMEDHLTNLDLVSSFIADIEMVKESNTEEMVKKQAVASEDQPNDLDTPRQIHLISPAMFEEMAAQPPIDWSPVTPNLTSNISIDDQNLLGHLESSDSGCIYPVTDQSTIGRSSLCSIMVPGKEVSRLHARVLVKDEKVIMESVSKTNQLRINGKIILSEQGVTLMDGDGVQVGKELFVWHSDGIREVEVVTQDTHWDEKGSSDYASVEEQKEMVELIQSSDYTSVEDQKEMVELIQEDVVTHYVKGMVPPTFKYIVDQKNTSSDDSEGSVVVEMAKFID